MFLGMNDLVPMRRKLSCETLCMCGCMMHVNITTMDPGILGEGNDSEKSLGNHKLS